MSFTPPTFPLTCNIWNLARGETSTWPQTRPPDHAAVPCQLAQPVNLILNEQTFSFTSAPFQAVIIRMPSGTPINDGRFNQALSARGFGDQVELPAGSGTVYGVTSKLTVGKGYPNEHVRCIAIAIVPPTGAE